MPSLIKYIIPIMHTFNIRFYLLSSGGALVRADQVRYITYKLIIDDCSNPALALPASIKQTGVSDTCINQTF
jgi:hypothetical protein